MQPDDSLYSIAWAFGLDYHDLARYNHLSEPYALHAGQVLYMYPLVAAATAPAQLKVTEPTPPAAVSIVPATRMTTANSSTPSRQTDSSQLRPKTVSQPAKTAPPAVVETKPVFAAVTVPHPAGEKWQWPTKGRVVRGYSEAAGGNHGLDIAGKLNQPVVAAAAGKVVYAGSGMPGYGNLIIIKHNENDLSAYAFNKTLAVKEGDNVKAGQLIANMGKNDSGKTLLHFEIRRDGKPVDPKSYLK